MDIPEFIDYVMSFYGPGGIYDFGATPAEVLAATLIRQSKADFCGDTFDREAVRDIILADREKNLG